MFPVTKAQVGSAMELLSILEMAKDATALKASLAEIQARIDEQGQALRAAEEERAAAAVERQAADDQIARSQAILADIDAQRQRLQEQSLQVEQDRLHQKDERDQFDRWMAEQRDQISREKALIESESVRIKRDLEAIKDRTAMLDDERKKLDERAQAIAAGEADLAARLEKLKSFVG